MTDQERRLWALDIVQQHGRAVLVDKNYDEAQVAMLTLALKLLYFEADEL